jgi:hypothetical protein
MSFLYTGGSSFNQEMPPSPSQRGARQFQGSANRSNGILRFRTNDLKYALLLVDIFNQGPAPTPHQTGLFSAPRSRSVFVRIRLIPFVFGVFFLPLI